MTEPLVLVDHQDGIAIVTLNRPTALNALSTGLRNAISDTFVELKSDEKTEVIILTGAGRAFTVGLDLKELGGEKPADAARAAIDLADALADVPQPIIGAVHGFAITGGFELALMCDFLIASPEARFADTHARVGVVPGWGLSQRLPRLIGANRAKELSLTGNYLDAPTAYAWGLVNRVVPADQLMPTCLQLARDILTTEPVTRGEIKRLINAGWYSTLAEGLQIEDEASKAHGRREVRPEKVAARRASIQARGREQSGN